MPGFAEVSPQTGVIDEDAWATLRGIDPDAALVLLAELTGATDERLATVARRLAGRVLLTLARGGPASRPGVGRLRPRRAEPGVDVDVDASLDALVLARGARRSPAVEDLVGRGWVRPGTALCLVLDTSGSMGGRRLASAALATAAVALRAEEDYSVLSFSSQVQVVKDQEQHRPAEQVVGDVLSVRGHGTTDLGLALRAAQEQLARARAPRRAVLLLSDGRATAGGDPVGQAHGIETLLVLAPAGSGESDGQARALAMAAGGRYAEIDGPSQVPAAIAALWP